MARRASTISSSRTAMARLTWQVSPRNKISAYFDEIDKYRGHDMQANYDPETAAQVWNSPAYHTTAIKWTSPVTSSLFLEAGFSNNTEYYTNEYRDGIEKPAFTAEWYRNAAKNELDLGGYTQAGPINTTESPVAFYWNAAATWVKGAHTIKFGANNRQGTFKHTRLANADLVQQYRSSVHRRALVGARHRADPQLAAVLRRAPEPRPRHLHPGFVAPQPPDRELRPALGDAQRQGAGRQVAGRPVRAGTQLRRGRRRAGLERLRAAHGPGLRPVRQRPHRGQVLAQPLQPVAHHRHCRQLQPAAVADRDAAVARQERQRRRATARCAAPASPAPTARSTSPACRRTSASPRSTSTANIRAPGTSSRASRCRTNCSAACRLACRGGRGSSTT